jgi:transposase
MAADRAVSAAAEPPRAPTVVVLREIVNAIFYVMRSGCPWRLLPSDFPPWRTIYRWFHAWREAGLFERINHGLVMADRERTGREASPTGAIIDSQSAGLVMLVTMKPTRG